MLCKDITIFHDWGARIVVVIHRHCILPRGAFQRIGVAWLNKIVVSPHSVAILNPLLVMHGVIFIVSHVVGVNHPAA